MHFAIRYYSEYRIVLNVGGAQFLWLATFKSYAEITFTGLSFNSYRPNSASFSAVHKFHAPALTLKKMRKLSFLKIQHYTVYDQQCNPNPQVAS